jgi:hypothetical protein
MSRAKTMDNPLYRAYAAICPGGQSDGFENWVEAMSRLHQVVFPGAQVTDQALMDWLESSRMGGAAHAAAG